MPAGAEVTVPEPPLFRVSVVTSLKLGVTETFAAGTLNAQVAFVEPLQTVPVQLTKRLPVIGVAVSTTWVPKSSEARQSPPPPARIEPQAMVSGSALLT